MQVRGVKKVPVTVLEEVIYMSIGHVDQAMHNQREIGNSGIERGDRQDR
jgi:hypothetical protein